METKTESKNEFQEFFVGFQQIPNDILGALLKISNDEDERTIISSLQPTLLNQFKEVSLNATQLFEKAPKQTLTEVEKVLKISSANSVLKSLKQSLPSIGSLIGKLGINEIVHAVKKIIRKIFELLNKEMPKWLDAIFIIIDEIFNMLFGGTSAKLKNLFSLSEQNFLSELTHLTRLEKVSYGVMHEKDDDE